MEFVHLRVYSEYSLLDSPSRIEALIESAKQKGYQSLALTDKGTMFGTIPFYKACKAKGIKPIIGLDVRVGNRTALHTRDQFDHLVLLAVNKVGYDNLLKISTHMQCATGNISYIEKEDLVENASGLIALSGSISSKIGQELLHGEETTAFEMAMEYQRIFKEGFYLEMQDHSLREERQLNLLLSTFANKVNLPLTVTNAAHYINREDGEAHDCLRCIDAGQRFEDKNLVALPNHEYYLASPEEMTQQFRGYETALINTTDIAARCNVELNFNQTHLPLYPVPDGVTAFDYLQKICFDNLSERYSYQDERVTERLDYELSIINKMGFNDYFLIVWDFMKYAHEHQMITGPGRGSAAGSLVAYLLHITDVDPIEHNLLFERFLNPERVTMPDIDIDFPDVRRDEVIDYVHEKYGHDRVAQIVTFGTLAAKAAIRDVGRVLEVDNKLLDAMSKAIPSRPGLTLNQAKEESKVLKDLISSSKEGKRVFEIASTIEGLPRHTSTHAAGVVISAEPLTHHVPLLGGHHINLTQFPMNDLEEIGLLKMDFLGLRNLTLIEGILNDIEEEMGQRPSLSTIPMDDEATFSLLQKADTTGVFQLESDGMRQVLRKLKPTEFEDIVAVNALYRPGPMENIPLFISGKHKERTIEYLHHDLEPILKSTYGVIVYQEQIMQIASKLAGFSLGEADLLRRAVSKKKREVLESEREHFVRGCLEKGYPKDTALKVYEYIVRFADYGFNRSHAVAYSVIAYQLAYLKANYSRYFFSSLLNSAVGNQDRLATYLAEAKQKGMMVQPPSINSSQETFTVEKNTIRFGLLPVKNVGRNAIEEIVQKRTHPYKSLFDLCARISLKVVNKRALESLIFAGAMDEFGVSRSSMLASLEGAMNYGSEQSGQEGFFQDGETEPAYESVPPFDEAEMLAFEKEAIGFYLTAHPLDPYLDKLKGYVRNLTKDAIEAEDRAPLRLAVEVLKVRSIRTKKGQMMAFLTLGDETGEIEGVAFPDVWEKMESLLTKGEFLYVDGVGQKRNDQTNIIISRVMKLADIKPKKAKQTLFLKIEPHHESILSEVKKVLYQHTGDTEVVIYYSKTDKTVKLGEEWLVNPDSDCVHTLKKLLGERNVVKKPR
ncbi:DNA polymerase III subunit alpha [Bacillus hwajinpoensis]|uniref:DNA polymerase III subunit alpha n=1 Tax=Guptibacillus hwajinpoensis TaxID=208199 RepID=A0A845EW72_9BACL|nr:DNA polymerase III subunit alpha [Pseudalkalibacillus hwajinpoensis]MYL62788.1 DNA polymerase III subunit alpha [Pseudalkalibacillus hwajinpoensis]